MCRILFGAPCSIASGQELNSKHIETGYSLLSLSKRTMKHAEAPPKAAPQYAGALPHLGKRPEIKRVLSRLASSKNLLRTCRSIYMRPIMTRFGIRLRHSPKRCWQRSRNCGARPSFLVAHLLLMCLGSPRRMAMLVHFTWGPNRRCSGGRQVRLRNAPRWQLVVPCRPEQLRAPLLGWARWKLEALLRRSLPNFRLATWSN